MTKKIQFLRHWIIGQRFSWFDISPSSLPNSCSSSSWLWFSNFWFASHEKFWPIEWDTLSDPLFTDIILISTPYLPCRQQVVTSNTGPILVFPLIQPFGSDVSSSLGKVYSRQATESVNCENSSVSFVMKYCPTSTTVRNPASVQNLLNLSCCDNFSIRSPYLCNSNSFVCRIIIVQRHVCVDHIWHERGTRLFSHNGSSRVIGFIFFTHFCDCPVKTELIYRSNCAKNSCNRFQVGTIVDRQFSTAFAFELTSGQWTRGSERLGVRFLRMSIIIFSAILSHSPCGLSSLIEYHFFSEPGPRMTIVLLRIFFANRETSWAFDSHSFLLSFIHMRCRWTSTWR